MTNYLNNNKLFDFHCENLLENLSGYHRDSDTQPNTGKTLIEAHISGDAHNCFLLLEYPHKCPDYTEENSFDYTKQLWGCS
jgi:hypothetical protein